MVTCNNKYPWINHHIKQPSRQQKRSYKRAKASNLAFVWQHYKSFKKEMQRECRKAHNTYMTRTLFDPFRNGRKKNFFRYIKSIHKDNYGIPTVLKDGTMHSSDVEKAKILNNHFAFVFI